MIVERSNYPEGSDDDDCPLFTDITLSVRWMGGEIKRELVLEYGTHNGRVSSYGFDIDDPADRLVLGIKESGLKAAAKFLRREQDWIGQYTDPVTRFGDGRTGVAKDTSTERGMPIETR